MDNPGRRHRGAGRISWGDVGGTSERVTGIVWLENDSTDTLTDVVLTIDFVDTSSYRVEGSKDYPIGQLDPRQSLSINYRWDNWQGASVEPKIRVAYRGTDDPEPRVVKWDGYAN